MDLYVGFTRHLRQVGLGKGSSPPGYQQRRPVVAVAAHDEGRHSVLAQERQKRRTHTIAEHKVEQRRVERLSLGRLEEMVRLAERRSPNELDAVRLERPGHGARHVFLILDV